MFWKNSGKKPEKTETTRSRPLVDDFTHKKEASREALDEINRRLGILSAEEKEELYRDNSQKAKAEVPSLNRGDLSIPVHAAKYEKPAAAALPSSGAAPSSPKDTPKTPEPNKKKSPPPPPLRRPI